MRTVLIGLRPHDKDIGLHTERLGAAGREGKCQVGYEVDGSGKIVGWTIVEKPGECVIEPPRP